VTDTPTPRDLLPLLTSSWYSASGDVKQKALDSLSILQDKVFTEEQYIHFIESSFSEIPSTIRRKQNSRFIPSHGISDLNKYSKYSQMMPVDDFVLNLDLDT